MPPLRLSPTAAMRTLRLSQPIRSQPFSVISRIRQAARGFEPHPFERYPTSTKAAPADWGRQFRKLGDAAMFALKFGQGNRPSNGGGGKKHWFLTAVLILGWDTCTYIFGETFWDQIGQEEWLDDG
ncbi:uncharacterized protein LY89DRAFT_668146 [Mollisia scopiformis]|uniref:Uncharacterized protein n=1 Tax=Mollisia scopiformis TaxID=149040 RepID=A0A194XCQ6_MOLSC|nr:uncharacterized protein LY89DRAFT_668146 [Mollisia scopiformis]KUJ17936.1 hypothetical protein LY89DRAFT_668146 [Mollisia scopiformis]